MNLTELFEPTDLPHNNVVEFVQEKCSNIIDTYNDTERLLYRGFKIPIEKDVFISESPIKRKPIDSSEIASKIFDMALKQDGIRALRSNSIFTVAHLVRANSYTRDTNQIFAIFPINGFDYCWSASEDDMVITNNRMLISLKIDFNIDPTMTGGKMRDAAGKKLKNEIIENNKIKDEYLQKILDRYEPRNFDIKTAIMKKHEVWIHGSYVAIRQTEGKLIYQILA